MICCIDANIFIWGLKKTCNAGDEHLMNRAIHLFKFIDTNKYKLMIPTVVIGEVLASEPLERYPVILDLIGKNTMLVDFDQRAAIKFAQLFTNKIEDLKKVAAENEIDKQKMKIDHLIVACALVNGANCIYSHDKGLKVFGQKYIDVKELPPLPVIQPDLFSLLVNPPENIKEEDTGSSEDAPF